MRWKVPDFSSCGSVLPEVFSGKRAVFYFQVETFRRTVFRFILPVIKSGGHSLSVFVL